MLTQIYAVAHGTQGNTAWRPGLSRSMDAEMPRGMECELLWCSVRAAAGLSVECPVLLGWVFTCASADPGMPKSALGCELLWKLCSVRARASVYVLVFCSVLCICAKLQPLLPVRSMCTVSIARLDFLEHMLHETSCHRIGNIESPHI